MPIAAALEALRVYAKPFYKTLRKLKKYAFVANDIMKALMNLSSIDIVSGLGSIIST